jgi:hypothetical protein
MTICSKENTMRRYVLTALASAVLGVALPAQAVTAGKVLFAQPGTEIVNEKGERRAAKRGDSIEAGERLITQGGGISQVLLPDGSLIGLRPSSELKLEALPSGERTAPALSLVGGALRVIGSDLMDAQKISALTLRSGAATLKLAGADLETAVVRAGDPSRPAGTAEAGTYTRLLVGTGSIATAGVADAALTQRQVAFIGTQPAAPVLISSLPVDVFSFPLATTSLRTAVASTGTLATLPLSTSTGTRTLISPTTLVSPTITSPLITAVAPTTLSSSLITRPTTTTTTTTLIAPRTTCRQVLIGGRLVCI